MIDPAAYAETASRNRRHFLKFLAGSPLLAQAFAQEAFQQAPFKLANAKDAFSVMDFEASAHAALPPAHWGTLTSGVDDDLTFKANIAGYKRIQLKPRRLADIATVDTKIELLGATWDSPVFICPVGEQKEFHPEGEIATAKAARAKKTLQVLSSVTSSSVEDVTKALGTAPWYQLYMPSTWEGTVKVVRRVEEAGCPALAWTIDLISGRNLETASRFARLDTRECTNCHPGRGGAIFRPMSQGLPTGDDSRYPNWSYVERLRKITKMKLILKGIESREDARIAKEHGVDGIVVSNHGGRATEDYRATIESLPGVVEAAGPQIPVLVDGGVRRGTDVFKALALGARAVGIGRPYIYGLASFGQEGVERVLDILRAELAMTMRQCGVTSIKQITKSSVYLPGDRG